MNVESLKFEEIKAEYDNLIKSKLDNIEQEINNCNEELESLKRIEEKEAELEEISNILERHNLSNETTNGFISIINSISNPSLAKDQINKFIDYVVNALSKTKDDYTEKLENLQESKEMIKGLEKSLDNPESQKEMIIKLTESEAFDDSEKLAIVKYVAYKSVVKDYERSPEEALKDKEIVEKQDDFENEQEIDMDQETNEPDLEKPEIEAVEKEKDEQENVDESEEQEPINEDVTEEDIESNSFELPELEDIPEIEETPEENKEEVEENDEIEKEIFESSETKDLKEINEEPKEEIPETPKEFNKKYGEDLKYAKHILEKRESTHFDTFYDTLTEKSSDGLNEEEKELLEKCKVLANSLKSSYFNVDYESEEIKKLLEEKDMEKVMEHYKDLKVDLDKYQPTFDEFKEMYLEFKSVFGAITNDEKEEKHKKEDADNEESVENEEHKKVTGITKISEAIKETFTHHKEKEDIDEDPLKEKYKEDLEIIANATEKYDKLDENEKSPTLTSTIESLKIYKDKGVPAKVTESEIAIIESSINWFKKRAESLGLDEKLFPEEIKKEDEPEEKGRRL